MGPGPAGWARERFGGHIPLLFLAKDVKLSERVESGSWGTSRFGGHIPLIGVASWARVERRDALAVEDGGPNLGYDTRPPAKYLVGPHGEAKGAPRPQAPGAAGPYLDPNHTHFILVVRGERERERERRSEERCRERVCQYV